MSALKIGLGSSKLDFKETIFLEHLKKNCLETQKIDLDIHLIKHSLTKSLITP